MSHTNDCHSEAAQVSWRRVEKIKVLCNTLPSAGSLGLYLYSVSLGSVWEPSSEKNRHEESSTSSSAVWKLLRNGGSNVKELWTGAGAAGASRHGWVFTAQDLLESASQQRVSLLWQAGLLFYTHL